MSGTYGGFQIPLKSGRPFGSRGGGPVGGATSGVPPLVWAATGLIRAAKAPSRHRTASPDRAVDLIDFMTSTLLFLSPQCATGHAKLRSSIHNLDGRDSFKHTEEVESASKTPAMLSYVHGSSLVPLLGETIGASLNR